MIISMTRGRRRPRPPPNDNFVPNWSEQITDFEEMGLIPELVHGIFSYGFKSPSDIQALAIKPIVDRRQVIAQARSGTGKTGAFGIGILNNLDLTSQSTQAFVIAPTRELATQTFDFLNAIGSRMPNLQVALFIGGHPLQEDQAKAVANPHVAVGAPGRMLDLIRTGHLRCEAIHIACLDEADELLKEGFLEQTQEIFKYLSPGIQCLLFSATIPLEAFNIMEAFTHDPVKILVKAEELTLDGISQFFVNVGDADNKMPTLLDIFGRLPIQKSVIFANQREAVDYVEAQLTGAGFSVTAIHSGLQQSVRDSIMKDFRTGKSRVLIGSDLIARGIDVQQVTIVINFELPRARESYLHRIGRSARWGRKGIAINICDAKDCRQIEDLSRYYATQITELPSDIERIVNEVNEDHAQREERDYV
jgi:superfamily II DNA/RNA helicase